MFRRLPRTDESNSARAAAGVYAGLRNQILSLDPAAAGLVPTPQGGPWGCVMDMGYPNGTATLVCLSDGTTSLYTSSGSGFIGGGAHPDVVRENVKLLRTLSDHLDLMAAGKDDSLPQVGRTVIRALTATGQRTYESTDDELGEGRSVMSPVFYAAHDVITQLRLIDEAASR